YYAANLSDYYISPIVRGMRRNKKRKARSRILNRDELRAVWKAADDSGTFGAILQCCLLTAQRRDKVASMKWNDIAEGVWTIATADREKGTAGKLALPKLALDIIEEQPRIVSNPYVFASGANKHFNAWAQR